MQGARNPESGVATNKERLLATPPIDIFHQPTNKKTQPSIERLGFSLRHPSQPSTEDLS